MVQVRVMPSCAVTMICRGNGLPASPGAAPYAALHDYAANRNARPAIRRRWDKGHLRDVSRKGQGVTGRLASERRGQRPCKNRQAAQGQQRHADPALERRWTS